MNEVQAYEKHRNLKLAASELGIGWQTLYSRLKRAGVPVTGDKLRYGTDRDRLAAIGEAEFQRLVPQAVSENERKYQSKFDFTVGSQKVDVKASLPRRLSKKYEALSWSFSFKKQSFICDFFCCICFDVSRSVQHVLLVPREFFAGLQTISVPCSGASKWLDYSVAPDELADFFSSLAEAA